MSKIVQFYNRQPDYVKYAGMGVLVLGASKAAWDIGKAYGAAGFKDLSIGITNLLAMPWKAAAALVGKIFNFFQFTKLQDAVREAIGDWDGDGKNSGIIGEGWGLVKKPFKEAGW